jgi:hypothetical protein
MCNGEYSVVRTDEFTATYTGLGQGPTMLAAAVRVAASISDSTTLVECFRYIGLRIYRIAQALRKKADDPACPLF